MTCWVIIPVKGSDRGKQRLAGVLDGPGRSALIQAMLAKVVAAAQGAVTSDACFILTPSDDRFALPVLADPGDGLNAALTSALAEAEQGGATRAVFVAADLPQLTAEDVERMSLVSAGAVAIAPDRHGTGTNALSLPLPLARDFHFSFGTDSFARHGEEARRLALEIEIIHSSGLMRDVDEPGDLADATGLTG